MLKKYYLFKKYDQKSQQFQFRVLEQDNNLCYTLLIGTNEYYNSMTDIIEIYSRSIPRTFDVKYNYEFDKGECLLEFNKLDQLPNLIIENFPEELL